MPKKRQEGPGRDKQKAGSSSACRDFLPGRRGFAQVVVHAPERIKRVYLRRDLNLGKETTAALATARTSGIEIVEMDKPSFEELLPEVNSQGILAELHCESLSLEQLFESLADREHAGPQILLLCDQISDPHNLGAILRAAESFGALAVLTTLDHSAKLSATARKSSAGASELIPVVEIGNLQRSVKKLKEEGFWILGAALGEDSTPISKVARFEKLCIILGSEGRGMRELSKKLCDVLLEIPLAGKTASLNVSQAAAVLLYHFGSAGGSD